MNTITTYYRVGNLSTGDYSQKFYTLEEARKFYEEEVEDGKAADAEIDDIRTSSIDVEDFIYIKKFTIDEDNDEVLEEVVR